jgi:hypothetical protein
MRRPKTVSWEQYVECYCWRKGEWLAAEKGMYDLYLDERAYAVYIDCMA